MNELLQNLPAYLSGHLQISLAALAIGIGISLPLAVLISRRRALRWPVLAGTGVVQTIPSLALLALMYPVMLGVSALLGMMGVEVSAFGFAPAVAALTLYSMLPIIRNTVTGIAGVDAAIIEAARGVGMTPRQRLFRVELPLAAPVIIAGVRTATVWVVGIATLATPIGQPCLGNYIFTGLDLRDWQQVVFGCVLAATLALAMDATIAQLELAARRSQPWRLWIAGAGIALLLAMLLSPLYISFGARADAPVPNDAPAFVVGSKNFTEQYILGELLADRLADAGFDVSTTQGLGSAVVFEALAAGDIDCYVDYSGTIWLNYMKATGKADRQKIITDVTQWLDETHRVNCLGSLGFENTYSLAMPKARAEALGIKTIADLAKHAADMKIAGTTEFFGRPEWKNLRDAYRLNFSEQVTLNPTLMYEAAASGDVDVISGFSTDGRIAAYDLVVLRDTKQVIPPYDAIVLIGPHFANNPRALEALEPLINAIDVPLMQQANHHVDRNTNPQSPRAAAKWLNEQLMAK